MSGGHVHSHDAPHAGDVRLLDFSEPSVQSKIDELMEACEQVDGHLPFGDHELLAIASGTLEGHVGFGIVAETTLNAYAHLSRLGATWFVEVAVRPGWRGRGMSSRLMDAVIAHVAEDGGGTLSTWAYKMDGPTAGLARHVGFRPTRTLFQLRLQTLPDGAPPLPDGYTLDRFRPGIDDEEWLALNKAAFAHLPDQGAWTHADLASRLAASWFDPQDFLTIRDRQGDLAGACWCKLDPHVHSHEGEQLGEIYVIAVDPAHEGAGLGKTLALTALAHLNARGADVGMLYVDGRNTRALLLYDALGFHAHHEDVCLSVEVSGISGTSQAPQSE